jgi:hypothetical protein
MERKLIGHVGVDSGTLMIADPCYVTGDRWTKDDYDKYVVCMDEYTQVNNKHGASIATIFSSGFGDGVYGVYATYKNCGKWGKRIAKVEIELIP